MRKIIQSTSLVSLLSMLAFAAACGDDDSGGNTPDAGGSSIDSGGGGADAKTGTTFNVTLTKAAEVPPCANAGASAMGSGTVTVSADNTTITVNVTYSGLSGAATGGHIHAKEAGMNGPVVLPFSSLTSPITQTLTATNYVAAAGAPADFAAFVTSLKAGNAYVNIHTAATACPNGEIRGQIVP